MFDDIDNYLHFNMMNLILNEIVQKAKKFIKLLVLYFIFYTIVLNI